MATTIEEEADVVVTSAGEVIEPLKGTAIMKTKKISMLLLNVRIEALEAEEAEEIVVATTTDHTQEMMVTSETIDLKADPHMMMSLTEVAEAEQEVVSPEEVEHLEATLEIAEEAEEAIILEEVVNSEEDIEQEVLFLKTLHNHFISISKLRILR